MKFVMGIVNAFRYSKASKLTNSGKHKEALEVLSRFRGDEDYMARKTLFEADILHRMGSYIDACEKYNQFLSKQLSNIRVPENNLYLELYAKYYLSLASVKAGRAKKYEVALDEVQKAAASASTLVNAEFPP